MNVSTITKSIFLGSLTFFWIFFILLSYLSFSLKSAESHKSCILAGYASGGIIDYRLEVYKDSTFYLSSAINKKNKTWNTKLDTLLLLEDGQVCAKILNSETVEFKVDRYKSLSIMKIKKFSPPQIVEFPKNN